VRNRVPMFLRQKSDNDLFTLCPMSASRKKPSQRKIDAASGVLMGALREHMKTMPDGIANVGDYTVWGAKLAGIIVRSSL
jgi:hypothetical protein